MNLSEHKIRKVELIKFDGKRFKQVLEYIRQDQFHIRPSLPMKYLTKFSDVAENSIRNWLKFSGAKLLPRVIAYEILIKNKYETKFMELDAVVKHEGITYIVEIKTHMKNKFSTKGVAQLIKAKYLLSPKFSKLQYALIHVCCNPNIELKYDIDPNYFKQNKINSTQKGINFSLLNITPSHIITLANTYNITYESNLLRNLINEILQHKRRIKSIQNILNDENVEHEEIPIHYKEKTKEDFDDDDFVLRDKNYIGNDDMKILFSDLLNTESE